MMLAVLYALNFKRRHLAPIRIRTGYAPCSAQFNHPVFR